MFVNTQSSSIADLTAAIHRYITAHPNACDTLEGVSDWWLARQAYEDAHAGVAAALRVLIDRGQVEAIRALDGHVLYRAAAPPSGGASSGETGAGDDGASTMGHQS